MLIAARNAMMVDGWKNPYVTDGLVAMWDGEWNAGGGRHDPNATVWVDLSGNGHNFSLEGVSYSFSSDSLILGAGESINGSGSLGVSHVDIVFSASKSTPFYIGKLLNTGYNSSGVALRYATIGFDAASYSNVITDYGAPFASYSLHRRGVYKNGIVQSLTAAPFPADIGYLAVSTKDSNRNTLTCSLRDIRFYDRALTADEIAANYAVDKVRFNLP